MRTLADETEPKNIKEENDININSLLQSDKKIAAFIGASKSGTSFIINNIAKLLSQKGINVAILDTTQNKNTYYIYTKNEEALRKIAGTSIEKLVHREADGIKVNENLTVYTSYPGEKQNVQEVELILETLLKNHTLILIDCDFKTPIKYFKYVTELFLVQTMDVLTIQPFTEILSEMKSAGKLENSKLRIIINKYVKLQGITEKEIIGAMSFYNDPSMSYMRELFNRNTIKYITIPFGKDIYERYLEAIAKCDINLDEYAYDFIQILNELGNEIYPFT